MAGPAAAGGADAFHHAGVTPGRLGASTEAEYPPGYFSAESAAASEPVLGRYPLHFHHCGEGSRGTLVEGCVVRDSSRAFVPHGSHGITLRDCVAFRIRDDAYWWDERHPTDDLLWEHCAAFDVRHDPVGSGSPAGFLLGLGRGTTIRDCVAVGVHGGTGAAGFAWPAFASDRPDNQWVARDLVAHNCAGDGLYVWQDDNRPHRVDDVVGYRNGGSGLVHGAHRNGYRYAGVVLFDNAYADLYHLALNRDDAAGRAAVDRAGRRTCCSARTARTPPSGPLPRRARRAADRGRDRAGRRRLRAARRPRALRRHRAPAAVPDRAGRSRRVGRHGLSDAGARRVVTDAVRRPR